MALAPAQQGPAELRRWPGAQLPLRAAVSQAAQLGQGRWWRAIEPGSGGLHSTQEGDTAGLNTLEEKLAEVLGLAQAAQEAAGKVEGLIDDSDLAAKLRQMRQEAAETEERCAKLAGNRGGKKTAILDKVVD